MAETRVNSYFENMFLKLKRPIDNIKRQAIIFNACLLNMVLENGHDKRKSCKKKNDIGNNLECSLINPFK
jgi:hypothetical protein